MIAAVDTCVLLDVLIPDPLFADGSEALLQQYGADGLVISPEVYADLLPQFGQPRTLEALLVELGIEVIPTEISVARLAGLRWGYYRRSGGPRTRITTDFIVGAHAQVHTGCLLTRDEGFFRAYFAGLEVVSPEPTPLP